jgi:hypothetical protein
MSMTGTNPNIKKHIGFWDMSLRIQKIAFGIRIDYHIVKGEDFNEGSFNNHRMQI